ncbi:symmetrical bis(5'-nucleosyl)-tetraphosphatase [Salinisphaera sp. LB1]|uniref:symmetrical bis(5'-nucleosyl)-tetraphosphatase n=1 Tax=Salinisphaera sp. LB1 TaxID=2183911 RepID=UPI000D7055E6|nr:symmetrical bis(5'-nucleosyl)-tetraphosphatase [Salinisphaera sp. LB1]AWN16295.1 Bis(5'-nucleosyl)-tetraphosphatase, symmetrical [Salinisphaera sp. LB1]
MSIYAIGDIHGAADLLDKLLDRLAARGPIERLWFVGDLVNRGPDSAGVIRRVKALGDTAITVLGNHDLSLLSLAVRADAAQRAPDSLKPLLAAADRQPLLDWLRHRPLMHHDADLGWTMVHAGLPPGWPVAEGLARARELEAALRAPDHAAFLGQLFGNTPERWHSGLRGVPRLRFIANALTRLRFVGPNRRLDMDYKKTLAGAPPELTPWFAVPGRVSAGQRIVFGHWSALERVAWPEYNVWGIDTGAAWGGTLSALDLTRPTPELIQVAARD